MAQLDATQRQLNAAKASTEKDNEIIVQLRKENALLHEIVDRKGLAARESGEARRPTPWFKRLFGPHRPTATASATTPSGSRNIPSPIWINI